MKLLTKELLKKIPPLKGATPGEVEMEDRMYWAKVNNTFDNKPRYILEYDGEDICFGRVETIEPGLVSFEFFSLKAWRLTAELYGGTIKLDRQFKPMSDSEAYSGEFGFL